MKKTHLLTLVLLLSSCKGPSYQRVRYNAPGEFINDEFYLPMNTINTLTMYEEDKLNEIKDKYNDLLLKYSKLLDTNFDSPELKNLKYLNDHSGEDEYVEVDEELFNCIEFALNFSILTKNKFCLAVGNLTNLYDPLLNGETSTIPSDEDISIALESIPNFLELINYIHLDKTNHSVKIDKINNRKILINLGAIGKGYITDKICEEFEKLNYPMVISSGASTIALLGENPMDKNGEYAIGFRDVSLMNYSDTDLFRNGNGNIMTINVKGNYYVSSSGDDEKFRYINQQFITHIIDPNTGKNNDVFRSTTVTTKTRNNTLLDGLTTALFNCNRDRKSVV